MTYRELVSGLATFPIYQWPPKECCKVGHQSCLNKGTEHKETGIQTGAP